MTSFLVNPTEGYRTFSRFDSLRCWPSISMVESVKVISAPPFCLKLGRAQNTGLSAPGALDSMASRLTTSLPPTYFQTSALLVRPNYVLCRIYPLRCRRPDETPQAEDRHFLRYFLSLGI